MMDSIRDEGVLLLAVVRRGDNFERSVKMGSNGRLCRRKTMSAIEGLN